MNIDESKEVDLLTNDERLRSDFVRELVQGCHAPVHIRKTYFGETPKCIVHFWDNLDQLPKDVKECMDSWSTLKRSGFSFKVFDEKAAKEFIENNLGSRFARAFEKCYHPSMKSDYFRYSYIFVEGGFYIDADDIYHGGSIDHLFTDGRLKLQPFCYDISTSKMVSPSVFAKPAANESGWIFYFNTTPLIASKKHPIVQRMLLNATISLEQEIEGGLPEVQATTGPGNLTRSIFEMLADDKCPEEALLVMNDWEKVSTSMWPLSYRNDKRNWRLSNQQAYRASK